MRSKASKEAINNIDVPVSSILGAKTRAKDMSLEEDYLNAQETDQSIFELSKSEEKDIHNKSLAFLDVKDRRLDVKVGDLINEETNKNRVELFTADEFHKVKTIDSEENIASNGALNSRDENSPSAERAFSRTAKKRTSAGKRRITGETVKETITYKKNILAAAKLIAGEKEQSIGLYLCELLEKQPEIQSVLEAPQEELETKRDKQREIELYQSKIAELKRL